MSSSLEIKQEGSEMVIRISMDKIVGDFLSQEEQVQELLNRVGCEMVKGLLKSYDTDGGSIEVEGKVYTSKGCEKKKYETLFGEVSVYREVYQSSAGGATYIPMDANIGFYGSSSPLLCKVVGFKYSYGSGKPVAEDMALSHKRLISKTLIQHIGARIGENAQASAGVWSYALPICADLVHTIGIGVDGTCSPIKGEDYKEAMCGTLCFYGADGVRLHSIYLGHSPEAGKASFYSLMRAEIIATKNMCRNAILVGIADGAATNWIFLAEHVKVQIIDFFHVSEYVCDLAKEMFSNLNNRKEWLDNCFTGLKNTPNFAAKILDQLLCWKDNLAKKAILTPLNKTITYFQNHLHQMDYATYLKKGYPIGSGVTESACKVLVKQRFNLSGSQWTRKQMDNVLTLRALVLSNRWELFWQKLHNKIAA